jgi:hypothetical protein
MGSLFGSPSGHASVGGGQRCSHAETAVTIGGPERAPDTPRSRRSSVPERTDAASNPSASPTCRSERLDGGSSSSTGPAGVEAAQPEAANTVNVVARSLLMSVRCLTGQTPCDAQCARLWFQGQDAALVQTVCPASWQQVAIALPSPHSQHPPAGMYGWQAPATHT